MEETKGKDKDYEVYFRKLAEDIYDLDEMVYEALGSGLGRVFSKDRKYSVRDMVETMEAPDGRHHLHTVIALIGNMARTIRDMEEHQEIREQHERIMTEMNELDSLLVGNFLDRKLSRLNLLNLGRRFSKKHHLIICIGRTFKSSGNDIGLKLADRLQIDYYDSEIFARVLERMDVGKEHPEDLSSYVLTECGGKAGSIKNIGKMKGMRNPFADFSHYHGLSLQDALFFNQSDLLLEMAEKQDFVVMGRCADMVLSNAGIPHVNIFITAPFERRVHRLMKDRNISLKRATKMIRTEDRRHARYYNFYTGKKWGDANNYDLCINSASFGEDGTVEFIVKVLKSNKVDINRAELRKKNRESE